MTIDLQAKLRRYWSYLVFVPAYALFTYIVTFVYPQLFGYVVLASLVGIFPASFTIATAGSIAYYYVWVHRRFHKGQPTTYQQNSTFRHSPPRLRKVGRSIVISVFGIVSILVSVFNLNPALVSDAVGFVLMIFSTLIALFLAPSLNIASWLLTKTGYMYENTRDGTRINIGRTLRQNLEFIIGPVAILNFIRVMFGNYQDPGIILSFAFFTLILSIPSSFVTLLLLRRKHLDRMSSKLEERLKICLS